MKSAIDLAETGRGFVHPNPLVGAVIVKDGIVVGRGFHTKYGAPHAEVEAINAARGPELCRNSAMFVTLEPCCHHGKTPPCTDAIIAAGIRSVEFAIGDPNLKVAGKGADVLRKAGLEVSEGLCADLAAEQNRAYLRYRRTGLPFVTWKLALTPDGRTHHGNGIGERITGPESDADVDRLRNSADAVLVGVNTVIADDPGLRVRGFAGRDPVRIVFDTRLQTPAESALVRKNSDGKTMIVTAETDDRKRRPYLENNINIVTSERGGERLSLLPALRRIAEHGILHVLMEAGRTLGDEMLRQGLVQELIIYQRGNGEKPFAGRTVSVSRFGPDTKIVAAIDDSGSARRTFDEVT